MSSWPAIPYPEGAATCSAFHRYAQIVGKYRLAHAPWLNHSWHATLYVTARGLTTGPVHEPGGCFELSFDLCDQRLLVHSGNNSTREVALEPMSVAAFHDRVRDAVVSLGGTFSIHPRPNELPDAIAFGEDVDERPWDADAVHRFHEALTSIDAVFQSFRTGFIGKVSPVHLFWGSFDLAVTRFSGRSAPAHPGGVPNLPDIVTREAYSHEVASAGFWPGGGGVDEAMFYAYAYPTPDAFGDRPVEPRAASWNESLGEFLLPYDAVRSAPDPSRALIAFLESTYDAAATTGGWDRAALDIPRGKPRQPREVV